MTVAMFTYQIEQILSPYICIYRFNSSRSHFDAITVRKVDYISLSDTIYIIYDYFGAIDSIWCETLQVEPYPPLKIALTCAHLERSSSQIINTLSKASRSVTV
jgi:hypothetical protein